MAKVHVLEGTVVGGGYRCAIHYLVPAGSNSASVSWKDAIVASGRNTTVLTEGTGAGQISTAEKADIVAGDVVEVVATLQIDTSGGNVAQVTPMVTAVINEDKSRLAAILKWFGRAEGTVN